MAVIYKHLKKDTNEIFYIGIGKTILRAKNGNQRNNLWNKIASKHGWYYEIIEDGLSWEDACKKEKELILKYGKLSNKSGILANLTDGGDGTIGYNHTINSKNKMSISKSKPRKPHSDETIMKIKEKRKFQIFSEQTKVKMSNSTKKVMKSESRRNVNKIAKSDKKLYTFYKDGFVVESTRIDMVDKYGLTTSGIYKLINGKLKSHKDWKLFGNTNNISYLCENNK